MGDNGNNRHILIGYMVRIIQSTRKIFVLGNTIIKNITIFSIALLTYIPTSAISQGFKPSLPDSLYQYIEQVFDTIQENSLYASNVDFAQIKQDFYLNMRQAKTKNELFQEFGKVFVKLGDYHGGFYHEDYRYGMPSKNITVSDDLATGWKYGNSIRTKLLKDKYGYLFLPAMISKTPESRNHLAKQLQDSICKLCQQNIQGLILDLRLNFGGDMWAMLGGLIDLLGDGTYGYFLIPDGDKTPWKIYDNNLYEGDLKMTNLTKKCNIDPSIKVVGLISVVTSSSGEAVAISISQLSNTILMGETTSGYTTANKKIKLDQNTSIILASAYMTDVNGNYSEVIHPAIEIIGGDNFDDLTEDKKILKAIEWMKSN